jgi:outer membrane protein TolC
LAQGAVVRAPAPAPDDDAAVERVALPDAVQRALARNPSALVANQEIARSEALVREARAASLPILAGNGSYARGDSDRVQGGVVLVARDELAANLQLTIPILATRSWAQWSQAKTGVDVAHASRHEVERQVAAATARAYLAVVAQRRQIDNTQRALATARAHAEFTHTRFLGGVGNQIDDVRAGQQVATLQAQLATNFDALARTREALGVLMGAERPVDALNEAPLPAPPSTPAALERARSERSDLVLDLKRVRAAEQVRNDSWTDLMPTISAQLEPFYQNPPLTTIPQTGWQALLTLTVPFYDGGLRYGLKDERSALLAESRMAFDGSERQSKSDVRVALGEVRRAEESLQSAVDAANLAHNALDLVSAAYQAGATTNIEVIDAERQARDADTAMAIAEDSVRQAHLDLLVAVGRFP